MDQLQEGALGGGIVLAVEGVHGLGKFSHRGLLQPPDVVGVALENLVHPHALLPLAAAAHIAAAVLLGPGDHALGTQDASLQPRAQPDQPLNGCKAGGEGGGFHLALVAHNAHHHVPDIQGNGEPHRGQSRQIPGLVDGQHLLPHRHRRADRQCLVPLQHHVVAVVGEVEHRPAHPGDHAGGALNDLVDAVEKLPHPAVIYLVREAEGHHHHCHPAGSKGALVHLQDGLLAQQGQHPLRHEPPVGPAQVLPLPLLLLHGFCQAVQGGGQALQLVAGVDVDPGLVVALGQPLHPPGQRAHTQGHHDQIHHSQQKQQGDPHQQGNLQNNLLPVHPAHQRAVIRREYHQAQVSPQVQLKAAPLQPGGYPLLPGLLGQGGGKAAGYLPPGAGAHTAGGGLQDPAVPVGQVGPGRHIPIPAGRSPLHGAGQGPGQPGGVPLPLGGRQAHRAGQGIFRHRPVVLLLGGPDHRHQQHRPYGQRTGQQDTAPAHRHGHLTAPPALQPVPDQHRQQQQAQSRAQQQGPAGPGAPVEHPGQLRTGPALVQHQPVAAQQQQHPALAGDGQVRHIIQLLVHPQLQGLPHAGPGQVAVKHCKTGTV